MGCEEINFCQYLLNFLAVSVAFDFRKYMYTIESASHSKDVSWLCDQMNKQYFKIL